MTQCRAIVYSRVKNADYHLIAIPPDFTDEDRKWATKCIKSYTIPIGEYNQQDPIYGEINNDKYYIVFVACTLKSLQEGASNYKIDVEMTVDFKNRQISGFLGYVFDANREITSIENSKELNTYAELHKYIAQKWYARDSQPLSSDIHDIPISSDIHDIPTVQKTWLSQISDLFNEHRSVTGGIVGIGCSIVVLILSGFDIQSLPGFLLILGGFSAGTLIPIFVSQYSTKGE